MLHLNAGAGVCLSSLGAIYTVAGYDTCATLLHRGRESLACLYTSAIPSRCLKP